jgi:hypothetical protein
MEEETKTYIFASSNSSVSIILSADSKKEAWEDLNNIVKPEVNDFRLDSIEEE